MLFAGAAFAYSPAGYGVPELCGALAGAQEDGVAGLCHNPAAAHPDTDEWLLDVGVLGNGLSYTLDWSPDDTIEGAGASPVPGLAIAVPAGPVGFGFSFLPLYSRGGGDPAGKKDPQRFYSYEGSFQALAADLSLAVAVHRAFTVGAAVRVARITAQSRRAIDSGALIASLAGDDAGIAIGDPFLEGTQTIQSLSGYGVSGSIGARWERENGPAVGLAVHAPMRAVLEGDLSLVPSNYLTMEMTGHVQLTMLLPPAVFLSTAIPVGPSSVGVDVAWIGWGTMRTSEAVVTDARIVSSDALMQGILDDYGITEAEFLDTSTSITVTGMHDVVDVGVSARTPVGERLEFLGGAWYLPGAIPDHTAHPANLDFTMLDLRAALEWTATRKTTVGFGADWYQTLPRLIDTSAHDWEDPGEDGSVLPSGNGLYSLWFARVGVTLILRQPFARRSRV